MRHPPHVLDGVIHILSFFLAYVPAGSSRISRDQARE